MFLYIGEVMSHLNKRTNVVVMNNYNKYKNLSAQCTAHGQGALNSLEMVHSVMEKH